jgi:hypothetical protein
VRARGDGAGRQVKSETVTDVKTDRNERVSVSRRKQTRGHRKKNYLTTMARGTRQYHYTGVAAAALHTVLPMPPPPPLTTVRVGTLPLLRARDVTGLIARARVRARVQYCQQSRT